jgi:hypothetical protein
VGHDEKDYRDYDLMHERSRDLAVDSEEEDEEEAWVEVEVRLFSITAPNQVIWQGIVRTLVLLATIVIHLIMSLKTVQYC